ncbi:glycosyltransferase [Amaricoccus solimangrovi]|uniref:Glycosyltransferase family 4 protein n=1 Tax=Amaricoccus solimangrovi TaxID=2589815 RepID=A0A501W815_9RHOB|nr:glycosyltransferase family 4 protein [Amaricoccus solimangrovi]TPE45759.1 glycosyltransferase family 4 protein [Amaricoccus solimangrovi]
MRLIFVSSLVPGTAPEDGYEIANHAIVEGLRRAGARVTALGFISPGATPSDPEETALLGEVIIRTSDATAGMKLRWLATAALRGTTVSSAKLRVVTRETIRRELARLEPYDGLILNGVWLAGAFEEVFTARPYVFIAHNAEHVSARQNAARVESRVERILFRREARYLAELEERLCANAAFVLTLSDDDRHSLNVARDDRALSLPLVMPVAADMPGRSARTFDVGLIGSWIQVPNRIGLEWFLREVVPRLDAEVSIAVAGRTPRELSSDDPRVAMLGRVENARAFMRDCRVIALASRVGTGVQLKTIETFELGLPAVATRSSLRGISSVPANVEKADDAMAFAAALTRQIQGQRAGRVADLDGTGFRAAQLRRMDDVLRIAMDRLEAATRDREVPSGPRAGQATLRGP